METRTAPHGSGLPQQSVQSWPCDLKMPVPAQPRPERGKEDSVTEGAPWTGGEFGALLAMLPLRRASLSTQATEGSRAWIGPERWHRCWSPDPAVPQALTGLPVRGDDRPPFVCCPSAQRPPQRPSWPPRHAHVPLTLRASGPESGPPPGLSELLLPATLYVKRRRSFPCSM